LFYWANEVCYTKY